MRSFRVTQDGPPQFLAERTFQLHGDPSQLRERAIEIARSTLDSPSTSQPDTGSEASTISPVGPIVLAAGGAAVVAGVILAIVSLDQNATLHELCPNGVCADTPEMRDRESEMLALSNAADVLWIGGAVVAVTGLVLTLTLREETDVAATAACGSTGCEVQMEGRF